MKKNIYLVQVGDGFSAHSKSAYLPYAAGVIAAQAWSNPKVNAEFSLKRIIFLRETPEELIETLDEPFLVGFSCYLWNFEYNKAVARQVKGKYPNCLILFGGHQVTSDTSLLESNPFIDILIHGEGEEVFEKLLVALSENGEIDRVPNIIYRKKDGTLIQSKKERILGTDYPSPYTEGFFDDILKSHPDMGFSAILETNRGCTNNCSFCDWGPHETKVRMFPIERVKGDIRWFSENKIEYIWGADANFGQFERDRQIAEWLVEAKEKNGYPLRMKVNYAKYNNLNVFELSKCFAESDLSKSTTISFQTLSDTALENIGRRNMTIEHFSDLIFLYRSEGIPTYTELILALPGETYESFTQGIGKLIDSGQHSTIEIYDCVLLPNAQISDKDYVEQHRIKSVCVPFFQYHCENTADEVVEYWDLIISTATMPTEDWIKSKMFALTVQGLHCLGLLRFFAIYLRNSMDVPYHIFYQHLINWAFEHPDTALGKIFSETYQKVVGVPEGKNEQYWFDLKFGDVRWTLDEGIFLFLSTDIERFYREIEPFLKSLRIESSVFEQLMLYQINIIHIPDNEPKQLEFDYDFHNYFSKAMKNVPTKLLKKKNKVRISTDSFDSLADYARETVWYGRRLDKTVCSLEDGSLMVEYLS